MTIKLHSDMEAFLDLVHRIGPQASQEALQRTDRAVEEVIRVFDNYSNRERVMALAVLIVKAVESWKETV